MKNLPKSTEELLGKQRNTEGWTLSTEHSEYAALPVFGTSLNRLSRKILALKRKLKVKKTLSTNDVILISKLVGIAFPGSSSDGA